MINRANIGFLIFTNGYSTSSRFGNKELFYETPLLVPLNYSFKKGDFIFLRDRLRINFLLPLLTHFLPLGFIFVVRKLFLLEEFGSDVKHAIFVVNLYSSLLQRDTPAHQVLFSWTKVDDFDLS